MHNPRPRPAQFPVSAAFEHQPWDFSERRAKELVAQPPFDRSLQAMASSLITTYRGNWLLNRLVNDRGRAITTLVIIDLHFQSGQNGFTLTQIREEARLFGFGSPNRVSALIGTLRLSGFLRVEVSQDARVRRLLPTDRFLSLQRQRLKGNFTAQLALHPQLRPALAAVETDEFLDPFMRAYVGLWKQGLRVTCYSSALSSLVERDAAFIILLALVSRDPDLPVLSLSELARLFMVSRSHVASIMREAQAHNFVVQDGPRSGFIATPDLVEAVRVMVALIFLAQTEAATYALRICGNIAASA